MADQKILRKVAWDQELPIQAKPERHVDDCTNHETINAKRGAHGRCTAFFKCPNCPALESSDCKSFQFDDLDHQHQCIECGKKRHIKEWRCECDLHWHICRIHRYARCHKDQTHKQAKATNGQPQTTAQPKGKRAKQTVQGITPETGLIQTSHDAMAPTNKGNAAESKRTKAQKRPRSQDESAENVNIRQAKLHRTDLKRKREDNPNVLIDLGPIVHNDFIPHLYGPVLKKRFYGG